MADDIEDTRILYERGKYRGSLTHAFDALERLIDVFLATNGIKVRDRFGRKIAIKEYFGGEILGEFEEMFDARKNGMYERGFVPKDAVLKIMEEFLPKLMNKMNEKLPAKEKIKIETSI